MVECLSSRLSSALAPHKPGWGILVIPELGKWRQEDQKFNIIFTYLVCSRPDWATYILSKKKKQEVGVVEIGQVENLNSDYHHSYYKAWHGGVNL